MGFIAKCLVGVLGAFCDKKITQNLAFVLIGEGKEGQRNVRCKVCAALIIDEFNWK